MFFKSITVELGDVEVTIGDAVDSYTKFKMRIKNKSADIIMVKPNNIVLVVNGVKYKASEKNMFVGPFDEASKLIDVKGSQFRVPSYQVKLDGFYKVTVKKFFDAPPFKLPAAQNYFETGDFKITHLANDKKTDFVGVKFSVVYQGNDIAVIQPGEAALKFPNGAEFANMKRKPKPIILEKGQSDAFRLEWANISVSNGDAQFANLEVLWRRTFNTGTAKPLASKTAIIDWDPGLTDGKK